MSTTIGLAEFMPLVSPRVPDAPHPLILQAIRQAAIDFCEATRCWRYITTVALTDQGVAVAAPTYATIHEFETAQFDDGSGAPYFLKPALYSTFESDQLATANTGTPEYITQVGPGTVTVIPFPDSTVTGTLDMSVFLKPKNSNEWVITGGQAAGANDIVPDFLFSQYGEAMANGALERLFSMPAQKFSNARLALYHGGKFQMAKDANFNANIRGQQRTPRRSRYNAF